jgi:small-conductance mechanosensitive channel/CRP-like cAMP-binding protein
MSDFLRTTFEVLGFAVIVTLSAAIAARLRGRGAARAGASTPAGLAASLLPSFAVICLSAVLAYLLGACPALGEWFPVRHGAHFNAWLLFWSAVLAVRSVEALAIGLYAARGKPFPVPELLRAIIRLAFYLAAAFVIINRILGRDITTLLTSTALLTAVVGFALQGVLGNLLAGMSLHLVRSVVPGDWAAIDGVEGEVVETNWRETRLRTTGGHIINVPNSKVAEGVVHNMTRPTPRRRHVINIGASYSDAPADVIEALAASALSVPKVLRDPPPTAYVTEFKDFGINYQLRFWSEEYYNRVPIEGDVNRIIWYQFKRRGIEIPFPMSDKLLNDFMEVVYHQRSQAPAGEEVARRVSDLAASEFVTRSLVDEQGRPLLTREELRGLADGLRHVLYTAGETVFRQGEPGENCYVVVRGLVRGRIDADGAAEPVRFVVAPGAVIGEMTLMTGLPRSATVIAEEEVELLEIPKDAFVRLLGLRPEIPELLSRLVAQRAASNLAATEKLKAGAAHPDSLQQPGILKRFLNLLGLKR